MNEISRAWQGIDSEEEKMCLNGREWVGRIQLHCTLKKRHKIVKGKASGSNLISFQFPIALVSYPPGIKGRLFRSFPGCLNRESYLHWTGWSIPLPLYVHFEG